MWGYTSTYKSHHKPLFMENGHNSGTIIERRVDIFSGTIIERHVNALALDLGMHVSVVQMKMLMSKIYRQILSYNEK